MTESAEKATVEEPPRTRRRGRVAALVLTLAVLVLAAPFASSTVRTGVEVRWLTYRMRSDDRAVREQARLRLLGIGRPTIDAIYPEVVADEVADESPGCSIFIGRVASRKRASPPGLDQMTLDYELRLRDSPREFWSCFVEGAPACPTARLLFDPDARRELVVCRPHSGGSSHEMVWTVLEVAVPLDDDLAPAIIEAVKKRLETLEKVP